MSTSQDPIEIAEAATQFEAEAIAEVLRSEGFVATAFGGRTNLGVAERWVVLVNKADAVRARLAIIESRRDTVSLAVVESCPWCGYSLHGLASPEKCPECGRGLDLARLAPRVRGVVRANGVPPGSIRPVRSMLWVGVGLCAFVGVIGFMPLRDWTAITSTWAPLLMGIVVLVVALVVRRKAQQARRQRAMLAGEK